MVEANPVVTFDDKPKELDKSIFNKTETIKAVKVPVRWIQEFSKKVSHPHHLNLTLHSLVP